MIQKAALLGLFDPLELADETLGELRWTAVERLGRVCDEVVQDGIPKWCLTSDERSRVLSRISSADARRVAQAAGVDGDAFGQQLRSALFGSARPAAMPAPEMQEVAHRARGFASAVPFAARRKAADPQLVKQEIERREDAERLQAVLPSVLHGRGADRNAIEAFIYGRSIPPKYRLGDAGRRDDRMLLLTGIGGMGKSALLADVVSRARAKGRCSVVVIDFDRPSLWLGDRVEIAREISRQLARERPVLASRLKDFRMRLDALSDGSSPDSESSQFLKKEGYALSLLRNIAPGGERHPLVVILDTFEEVAVRGAEAARNIFDWMTALREDGGCARLRVIVAGRSRPDLAEAEIESRFSCHIALAGLDAEAAAALLSDKALGLPMFKGRRGREAARAFDGHPLLLRFLVQYARTNTVKDVDQLIREGLTTSTQGFSAQLAQVFLYSRILGRIRDDDVARLAHPGLVLRRVTPQLIRHVLVEPCGLGRVDEAGAQRLFDKLSATVWIVERTTLPDVVRHRRDLRRLMLPAMMTPPEGNARAEDLRKRAISIHRAAADWYGAGKDAILSSEEQEIEAFYHRVSADPEHPFDVETIMRLVPALGEDVVDLPPRIQAIAAAAAGRLASISESDEALLPEALAREVRAARRRQALKRGDTAEVVTSSRRLPQGVARSFSEAEKLYGAEVHALWVEADFAGVAAAGARIFERIFLEGSRDSSMDGLPDWVTSAAWKTLLAQALIGDWRLPLVGKPAIEHFLRIYGDDLEKLDSVRLSPCIFHLVALLLAAKAESSTPPTEHPAIRKFATTAWMRLGNQGLTTHYSHRGAKLLSELCPSRVLAEFPPPPTPIRLLRQLAPPLLEALCHPDDRVRGFELGGIRGKAILRQQRGRLRDLVEHRKPVGVTEFSELLREIEVSPLVLSYEARKDARHMVEGLLPELHTPLIEALAPLLKEDGVREAVAEAASSVPVAMSDLLSLTEQRLSHDKAQRLLAGLVPVLDQCGLLLEVVTAVDDLSPDGSRISRVLSLVLRVEELFHGKAEPEEQPAPRRAK